MAVLSKCCSAEAATVVNVDNFGLCAKCNNWVGFIDTNPLDEEEVEDELLSKAVAVIRFYADPTIYKLGVEQDARLIESDGGNTAREFLKKYILS